MTMKDNSKFEDMISRDLDVRASDGTYNRMRNIVLAAHEQSKQKSSAARLTIARRTIMKSPVTKIAAAAVIIAAILVLVHYLSGPVNIAAPAFADMMEQICKAQTICYTKTCILENRPGFTIKEMVMEPGLVRSERPDGYISIHDFNKRITLWLDSERKKAEITEQVGGPPIPRLFNYVEWISTLHESDSVLFETECAGTEKVNGQLATVFVVKGKMKNTKEITVWVDPKTNLPLRAKVIEWDTLGSDDTLTKITNIYSEFAWNVDLAPSLFSLEPPADYTVEKRRILLPDRRPGPQDLIAALRLWADVSGGTFPETIEKLTELKSQMLQEYDADGHPMGEYKKTVTTIKNALLFVKFQKLHGEWHYAGEGIEVGDVEMPICWFKLVSPPNTYRVIFGDLHEENIDSERLAELQRLFDE